MSPDTSPPEPTDHDSWTVHALNIHGAIFERWVEDIVEKLEPPWKFIASQFPVEYPPPYGATRGHESTLDVWADHRTEKRWLSLLIECKKNDPRFVDWVFFRAKGKKAGLVSLSGVDIGMLERRPAEANAVRLIDVEKEGPLAPLADDARELRGQYEDMKRGEFTKTSTKAIGDAAYQVTLATHAIIDEQIRGVRAKIDQGTRGFDWERRLFLPIIATTANLFLADFDPAVVDRETGTIERSAVTLNPTEWLWYLYPVPRHLQFATADALSLTDRGFHFLATRVAIAVVRSGYLPTFLKDLPIGPGAWVEVKTSPTTGLANG